MNATVANPEVHAYLEAVRTHLADVPEADREELLDDLEGHLLEVAAEDDGSLADRLGPPAVYAAELRETAGLPSAAPAGRERLSRRILESLERSAPARIIDTGWNSTSVQALRTFLPELRPGWWVARGYLAVAAGTILAYEGYYTNPVVPHALGGYAQGTILALVAIVASVLLGKAAMKHQQARRLSLIATGAVLVAMFAAVPRIGDMYVQTVYAGDNVEPQFLSHPDGTPIANICPYSADGTLLSGVLLFDQDGRAISNTYEEYIVGQPAIRNIYPRQLLEPDPNTGELAQLYCPTLLKAAPAPTPGG